MASIMKLHKHKFRVMNLSGFKEICLLAKTKKCVSFGGRHKIWIYWVTVNYIKNVLATKTKKTLLTAKTWLHVSNLVYSSILILMKICPQFESCI